MYPYLNSWTLLTSTLAQSRPLPFQLRRGTPSNRCQLQTSMGRSLLLPLDLLEQLEEEEEELFSLSVRISCRPLSKPW